MITLVFDIDGVLVAEQVEDAYKKYGDFLQYLPKSWQAYHQDHVITVHYENKEYHHLLLPGVLEMLEYFSIHLKEKVRIAFFFRRP